MASQSTRSPKRRIARRESGCVAKRGLHRFTGKEPGKAGGAEHIATSGGVEGFNGRRRDEGGADWLRGSGAAGPRGCSAESKSRVTFLPCCPAAPQPRCPSIEPRRGHIRYSAGAERHGQQRNAGAQCLRRKRERIGSELLHFVFVELDDIEAAEPAGSVSQRPKNPDAILLHTEKKAVQVCIQGAGKPLPKCLRGAERELETGYEVDIDRIEIADHGAQLAPGPARYPARHALAPALAGLIVQDDAIVGGGDLDAAGSRGHPGETAQEFLSLTAEVAPHLDQRNNLPSRSQARIQ